MSSAVLPIDPSEIDDDGRTDPSAWWRVGFDNHTLPRLLLMVLIAAIVLRPWDFIPALASIKPVTLGLISITGLLLMTGVSIHYFSMPLSRALLILWVFMLTGVFDSYSQAETADFAIKYVQYLILFGLLGTLIDSIAALSMMVRVVVGVGGVLGLMAVQMDRAGAYSAEGRIEGLGDGMLSDPNDLACMLVTIAPLGLWLLRRGASVLDRGLALGCLASLGLGILVTQSRGGLLAVVAAGGFFLLISKVPLYRKVLAGLFGVGLFLYAAPDAVLQRYATIASASQTDESAQSRLAVWKAGARMFADHPFNGCGVGTFEQVYGSRYIDRVGAGDVWRSAHNAYVEAAAELGLPGFICWCVFILGGVPLLWSRRQRLAAWIAGEEEIDPDVEDPVVDDARTLRYWSECAMASLVAFLAAATFLSKGFDIDTVIFIGTAVAGCMLIDGFADQFAES